MRRPLSERQAERAALAKAEMRARRTAAAARERRLERTKEAVEIWHHAKSLARELMRGARSDGKQVRFVKQGVRDSERQEVRRHCFMIHDIHRWRNCTCTRRGVMRSDYPGGGKISSYVYEEARLEEARARESRKLALEARNFEREARDAVASGSSEALRRVRRVEMRLNKLEDAFSQMWRNLEPEGHVEIVVRGEEGRGVLAGGRPYDCRSFGTRERVSRVAQIVAAG
jgi:hypothetical protein